MSKISLQPNASGAGTFSIVAPDSNTNRTLTLPDEAGEIVTSASSDLVPAGALMYFTMNTPPTGWLKANGAAVSRTTFADLFAEIGTTYGAGDGSTTFALPDMRGEFPRGWDDGRGVDGARGFGTEQTDSFQGHNFSSSNGKISGVEGSGNLEMKDSNTGGVNIRSRSIDQIISDGTNGTPRVASETRPRNIALLACIKF